LVIAERHLLGIGGRELHIHYLSAGKVEDIDNVAHCLPIGK
jgi:acyl-coenzyme A thioesterase PaaI-like protein